MRFLVDAQLPPALARWLAARGHEAEHVADRHLQSAPDAAIWDVAIEIAAVIITRDEDFSQRKVLENNGSRVIWLRLSNPRRREVLALFDKLLPEILTARERGETLIEII